MKIFHLKKIADVVSWFNGDKETMINVYGHVFLIEVGYFQIVEKVLLLNHIIIGLNMGQISHEYKVIERLSILNIKNSNIIK